MAKIQKKKKIVSFNFSLAVFSVLNSLTLEDVTDRLSRNVGKDITKLHYVLSQ